MSQKTRSNRVMFLPSITEKVKLSLKGGGDTKVRGRSRGAGGERQERAVGVGSGRCGFPREEEKLAAADESSSSSSLMKRLLRGLRATMGRAMCLVPVAKAGPTSAKLVRHSVCPHDYSSHRSEDIAECIDFINSSNSSLRGPS